MWWRVLWFTALVSLVACNKQASNATPAAGATLLRQQSLPSIGGELYVYDAAAIVQKGPRELVVLRFNHPVELRPHHFSGEGLEQPASATEWLRQIRAPVIFNAGQYDHEQNYLGWLKRDGDWLSSRRKRGWHALLMTGPLLDKAPWGRILDLEFGQPASSRDYAHVVQSMMLLDHTGRVRVRESGRAASRTAVLEDREGRLAVLLVEGAVTLADLARWLSAANLGIIRAMNLDGGFESQLVIRTEDLEAEFLGRYSTSSAASVFDPGMAVLGRPLPAVISVWRSDAPKDVPTPGRGG